MRLAPLVLLPLAACTGIQATTIYAGQQRPVAGACNPAGRASLTRRGTALLFAPSEGTLTLPGRLQDGRITAQNTFSGAEHRPYTLSFTGQLTGQHITGLFVTPRCRYGVELTLTAD